MTQPITRKLSATTRAITLALAVLMLLGVVLALPARLSAQTSTAANATEMLVFNWNKPVAKSDGGFAQYKPLSAYPQYNNGNWLSPVNWVNGTIYFRAKVFSIPKNQPSMKLGFCFWQNKPKFGEECSKNISVPGVAGTERRWSQTLKSFNKINGAAINWALPRWKAGFVVRGPNGPVSPKAGMNWGGQNPDHWYPLNIHYTAVLVINGGEPNWSQYGW